MIVDLVCNEKLVKDDSVQNGTNDSASRENQEKILSKQRIYIDE